MAEYIDREALLAEAKRISGPMTGDGWDNWGVYALINRQPAADVVEVIRCRDCRYNLGENKCLYPDSIIKIPDDNDYCSYGRRRLNHDRTGQELQALRKEIQSK